MKFSKWHKEQQREFARDIKLATIRNNEICLVVYPPKTSASNYHLRVRNQGSKNIAYANQVMTLLDNLENACTFSRLNSYSSHEGFKYALDFVKQKTGKEYKFFWGNK